MFFNTKKFIKKWKNYIIVYDKKKKTIEVLKKKDFFLNYSLKDKYLILERK